MRDYKNVRHAPASEAPMSSAIAALIWAALCGVLLTAPTWAPWLDSLGVCP